MPKAAQYALVWLPAQQTYDLQRADTLIMALPVDNAAWVAWLAEQRAFAFRGQQGQLSLLKESRQSGGAGYWYAYRRQGQRTRKRYVGRDAELTLAQLERVAAALNQPHATATVAPGLFTPPTAPLGNNPLPVDEALPEPPATLVTPTAPPEPANVIPPLLVPKLHWPRLHADLIARPRLLRQLDNALLRRLTIVVAPAGFGKTTLVRQWIAAQHQTMTTLAVAWLALDAADNDPVRCWRYVSEAFQSIQPGLGAPALRNSQR